MPRLVPHFCLEANVEFADAMVATDGLLGLLGLPLEVQGYWTEHSERSVLPTALSLMKLMDVPLHQDDLGRSPRRLR